MGRILKMLPILLSAAAVLCSQQLTEASADNFIKELLRSSPATRQRIDPAELLFAERLGIQYHNVTFKFFIGADFPDSIKNLVQSGRLHYSLSIEQQTGDYSALTVSIPEMSTRQKFYFKKQLCVSPVSYLTRGWQTYASKYIAFCVSDTSDFNTYSSKRLDDFIERVMDVLKFTKEEKRHLQKKKILYVRCKNEDEVEQITGFKTLGMAVLSSDAVVTQYNCHYHELVHLLMNYKLKTLPLFTHSFFQEGCAVALGGRGGKEANVILDLGHFIAVSGFETYTSLLKRNDFSAVDPSISYALSGLFNLFLLEELGVERYLRVYRKFSNSNPDSIPAISEKMLPVQEQWNLFLKSYSKQKPITLNSKTRKGKAIWSKGGEGVSENSREYIFTLRDTMTILSKEKRPKYIVSATPEEVQIYNVLSGNTIANFVSSFSFPLQSVPWKDGLFTFSVRKNIFDEPISKSLSFIVE